MRHPQLKSSTRSIAVFAASLLGLAATGPQSLAQVVVGSSFGMAVAGFNDPPTAGIFLAGTGGPLVAVFGSTTTFPGAGEGGQTVTISSSEVVGATTTTDTFTISVPTNFAPAGTVSTGTTPVEDMEADIGGFNAGPNPIQFQFPEPTLATVANGGTGTGVHGNMLYSGGTLDLSSGAQGNATLTNGNMSFASAEGVAAGGSDLAPFTIHSFSFTLTYPNPVPEPTSLALVGMFAGAGCAWRRWRAK